MKVFDFEQKMQKENENNVNLIYKYKSGKFAISTLKGKSNLNEVVKAERVFYDTLESLLKNSGQFSKHETFNSFLVDTSRSTDASKWEVSEILTIKKIKNTLSITDAEIGEMFGYKNYASYYNASRRKHIENGVVKLYELINKD